MRTNQPIGFFDSGVGGVTIWKEVHKLLPYENTIYLADSKYAPYGNRPRQEIIELSIKNVKKLQDFGCKLVVVACNTATTNAIEILREKFTIPLIGIEPAIKPAALLSKTKSIGILATKGTLNSDHFHKTSKHFSDHVVITEIVGEGLVPLIEEGKINSQEMLLLLKKHILPMLQADADYIVLGSTHFPHLRPILEKLLPINVHVIDSGEAVAKQTKKVLYDQNLLQPEEHNPSCKFYTNKDTDVLNSLLKDYGSSVSVEFLDF